MTDVGALPGRATSAGSRVRNRPVRNRRGPTRRLRAIGVGLLFVLPTFTFLGYFMYYPASVALAGAFTDWDGLNAARFVGLDNFRELVADPQMGKAAVNNLFWAVGKIALALVPSFIVAELIFAVRSSRWQYVYRTLFVIPIVVPSIVTILTWSFYYKTNGLVNQVLSGIGLGGLQHSWLADQDTALGALVLMEFPWVGPFNLLIFYAGLQQIPREILEAAAIDGARGWRRIRSIDIPLLSRQTGLLATLAVIGSVQAVLEPLIMTGGGPNNSTLTPILYLYQTGITYGRFGYSMAISLVLFLIVLVLGAITNRLTRPGDA